MNCLSATHLNQGRSKSHSLMAFLLMSLIFLTVGEAKAQWEAVGPDGGGTYTSTAIANWPGAEAIFVGNELGGLFRSTDGGETYAVIGDSLRANSTINAIAIDQKNPGVVYVATNIGVHKSTDSGNSWVLVVRISSKSTASELAGGNRLIVNPYDSKVIYFAANIDGLYKSVDAGQTWQSIQSGLPDKPVSIAAGHGRIYAAVFDYGIYRSNDGGLSWTIKNTNLPETDIVTIKMSLSASSILYAVSERKGVYKSTDYGNSWTAKSNGLNFNGTYDRYRALTIDYSDSDTVYLSSWHYSKIFKTTDGGENWTKHSNFYQEDTQSKGWSKRELAVGGSNPDLLILATGNAIFRSTDAGMNWHRKQSGIRSGIIEAVEYDENSSTIWIGNYDQGLYKSIDEGESWAYVWKGFTRDLLIDNNTNPSTIFWSLNNELRKSTDGGSSWNSITSYPGGGKILYCDSSRETMYATDGSGKIYKSIDAGDIWNLTETQPASGAYAIDSIAVDPANPDTVYAGTHSPDGGVYRSRDAGYTWTKILDTENFTTTSIALHPDEPSIILVGYEQWSSGNGLIFKSTDGGSNFVRTYEETGMPVKTVYIDPASPSHVHAVIGTTNPARELLGIMISSDDGGDSWMDTSKSADVSGFSDIIRHPTRNSLLAGSYGANLWESELQLGGRAGLVYHSTRDESGDDHEAHSSSDAGIEEVLQGATWGTHGMLSLSVLEFDGSSDYAELPERDGHFDFTNAFSITAWVYYDSEQGTVSVVGKSYGSYQFLLDTSLNRLILQMNNSTVINGSSNSLIPDTWLHVAVAYDAASGARTYVNGVLDAENNAFSEDVNISTIDLKIGATGNSASKFFSGLIGGVKVYNRALSEEEIALESTGMIGFVPGC